MANNINQVVDSLISINQVIENFRVQREKNELYDSNRFNPFQFLRTDEMGLSKILAFLLDPTETHGQGDLFLNSFLKFINKHQFLAYQKVNIYLEKITKEENDEITNETTNKNGRHDIFIEGILDNKRSWVISIENKLQGAIDQPKQMHTYAKDLKNYVSDSYFLIYLPIFSNNPPEKSISEDEWAELMSNKKAMVLSASMLIQWLDNTVIIAPAVKQFCNDFKKFLSEDIMGNTQNSNELIECLINNDKALFSALTVLETRETLYEKLMAMLVEQLKIRFNWYTKLININFECGEDESFNKKGYGLYIGNDDFGVCIYFNKKGLSDAYYGVYANNDNLFNNMTKIFHDFIIENNFDEPFDVFPLSKWLEDEYEVWDAKVLSKIPSGELASYIFDLWKPLLDIISDNLEEIKGLDINKS
ncbi:MAG: PD-(D/E)XK nuclease family protein [Haemophilus parainfluenzae]|nr:PD-(D/E)XK nuclease family protein [Haemophilus parainfluenzae]